MVYVYILFLALSFQNIGHAPKIILHDHFEILGNTSLGNTQFQVVVEQTSSVFNCFHLLFSSRPRDVEKTTSEDEAISNFDFLQNEGEDENDGGNADEADEADDGGNADDESDDRDDDVNERTRVVKKIKQGT